MFTPDLLADGQLPSSKTVIFSCPTGARVKILNITYFNTTAGALTCSTYVNGGTSRQIDSESVPATSRRIVSDATAPIFLDEGDSIEAAAGSATSVNYLIFGEMEQKA